jgi:hypothetical protein
VLGTLLTKLVNENKINWDEHLSTILFSYRTTYQSSNKVYTKSISVWITSIDAHKVHSATINGNEKDSASM